MILKDFGGVYKLHGADSDPLGPLGLMLREPTVQTNRGRMSATVTLSREAEDRSGDIVVIKGMRLDGHQKNPVVLLNHNKNHVIGFTQDALGNYTVKKSGDRLTAEVFFCKDSQLGVDTFRAVEAKILRGCSIGFLPVLGKIEKKHERGTIYHESNLIEATITPIGDNEDAVIEAVHKTFGRQPMAAELAAVLPAIPERSVVVTGGYEPVEKGGVGGGNGTYKNAEARQLESLTRESEYFVCPHCEREITRKHLHEDEDGTIRHGQCRGPVTFMDPPKPAPENEPTAVGITHLTPKMLTYIPTRRFLPGLRTKAMDELLQQDQGAAAPADDDMLPSDDMGPPMKGGAEAHHGVNDILMQAMAFIEDSQNTVDNATAKKTLAKVSKWLGKALEALHAGHGDYLTEHPDQDPLPGKPPGSDGDMDEDGEEDSEDDDDGLDADGDGEDDDGLDLEEGGDTEGDDSGDEKPKKKKKKGKSKPAFNDAEEKAAHEWRIKTLNGYWERLKQSAVVGDWPVVKAARAEFRAIVENKALPTIVRKAAKVQYLSLGGIITKEVKAAPAITVLVDEWAEWEKKHENN